MPRTFVFETSPIRVTMNGRIPSLLAGALVFACCAGCGSFQQRYQQQQEELKSTEEKGQSEEAANTFLKSITHSGKEAKWGLKESTIISRKIVGVNKQTDSPLTYGVSAEVWCEGNTLEGNLVRLKRTVLMKVVRSQDSKWTVMDYMLTAEESLSYWKQAASCFAQGVLVPLICFAVYLFLLYVALTVSNVLQWQGPFSLIEFFAFVPFWILITGIVNAFQCFGSWMEPIFFCIVPWSLLCFIAFQVYKVSKDNP